MRSYSANTSLIPASTVRSVAGESRPTRPVRSRLSKVISCETFTIDSRVDAWCTNLQDESGRS